MIDRFSHVPIILIGRSYGGPIASFITAVNQSKVKALLLISNAADPRLEKFWWFSKPIQSKLGKLLFRKSINVSSDEKFSHQNELQEMLPKWQQITQPTIVLQGGKDIIIDPYNGKFTDSMLVNAPHQYIFLPQNGHLISNESPRLIKECLMELLLKISKG
jgi:pimeloyl-ACP methyl ester carboxylesterase